MEDVPSKDGLRRGFVSVPNSFPDFASLVLVFVFRLSSLSFITIMSKSPIRTARNLAGNRARNGTGVRVWKIP
jgi:hypothetical protein